MRLANIQDKLKQRIAVGDELVPEPQQRDYGDFVVCFHERTSRGRSIDFRDEEDSFCTDLCLHTDEQTLGRYSSASRRVYDIPGALGHHKAHLYHRREKV